MVRYCSNFLISRVAFVTSVAFFQSDAVAQQYQINCLFEVSALARLDPKLVDPVVKKWHADWKSAEFLVQIDPPKIIDPPQDDLLWGSSSLRATAKEITMEFTLNIQPKARRPRIQLSINRFSGEAFEIFAMRESEDQGPEYGYGSRTGHCKIHSKKL